MNYIPGTFLIVFFYFPEQASAELLLPLLLSMDKPYNILNNGLAVQNSPENVYTRKVS